MRQISLVIGQAGTGKTTWLMEQAAKLAPQLITAEHRRLLAITRMHGARRRLEAKLRESCPGISCSVTTIDGFALSIVNALAECSSMLLAADDFQCLDPVVDGCPAVEWVTELQANGSAEISELTDCMRTSAKDILDAARCLRENTGSNDPTIPVFWCPNEGPAAWKIIDSLVLHYYSEPWRGTCALICPSHDPLLYKVVDSCNRQLQKKKHSPICWHEERSTEEEKKEIRTKLRVANTEGIYPCHWAGPCADLNMIENYVATRVQRFARLRGLAPIPVDVVERHVETTVHGAKNREFDNVFILWTHKLPPDHAQQRRLLYNAVTRAKRHCMVLVFGKEKRAQEDPVLSLLGPARPAISKKKKAKVCSAKKAAKK